MRTNKVAWFVFAFLAIGVGLYPILYFFTTKNLGLLYPKSTSFSENILWNIGFYGHIFLHGLALLTGWSLFGQKLKNKHFKLFDSLRKIYFVSAFVGGVCNVAIGLFSEGGWVTSLGFVLLALIWLYTTLTAYTAIHNKDLNLYQGMMIYSYASCFAAVTFRLWLPLLQLAFGELLIAYKIVAWLCWVPNLIFAHLWVKRKGLIIG